MVLEDFEGELAGVRGLHVVLHPLQLLLEPLVGARVHHLALGVRRLRGPGDEEDLAAGRVPDGVIGDELEVVDGVAAVVGGERRGEVVELGFDAAHLVHYHLLQVVVQLVHHEPVRAPRAQLLERLDALLVHRHSRHGVGHSWSEEICVVMLQRCHSGMLGICCGGFVVGLISVHTIADGLGAGQFINAVADYARGLPKPRVSPVWARDLVPDPPRMPAPPPKLELLDLRGHTVDFSPDYIANTKADFFASTGQRCSAFDVCVAKTWQSRTRALLLSGAGSFTADSPVHVCFFANTRHLMLAAAGAGFYGNCFYPVTVTCGSGEVAAGDVVDVVRAVRDAKARLAGDVARWAVGGFAQDPYELRFTYDSLFVSDWTRLGFLEADYGWGAPTHVVPFSYHPFMAVAVIGAPPAPKVGPRVMTMCVEEAHLPEFRDQMNAFASAAGK